MPPSVRSGLRRWNLAVRWLQQRRARTATRAYLDLYDERLKLHFGTYDYPDKHTVAEMYRGFFAATSDLALTIDEAFGDADRLCARYTVTGKQTGELMGIPPTGAEISIIGITIMHFENGRVLERWDVDDSAELFARLRAEAAR